MTDPCPLCKSGDVKIIERASYAAISTLYRQQYGIDIQRSSVGWLTYRECRSCGLLYFFPAVVGNGALYEHLQNIPWYYLQDKSEFRAVAPFIKSGDTVIEVGGGEGNFARYLPQGVAYIGVEFNDEAVRKARAKGLDVSKLSLQEFRLQRPEKADVVCTFQVLEHVPDPRQFISELLSLLKPGGILAISVPSEDSFMRHELNNVLNAPPHHQTRWTDETLRKIADMFGLKLLRLEHEVLSEQHVPSFAKAELLRLIKERLGIRLPMFSVMGGTWIFQKALGLLSRPLRRVTKSAASPIYGHTVTVIYGATSSIAT